MKLVVLDAGTLGDDLDLTPLKACGEVTVWKTTAPEEVEMHLGDAEVAIVNKVKLTEENLSGAHALRLICVAATGYDNIDIAFCRRAEIAVCNVAGYSTNSVAQVTASLALTLATHIPEYARYVSEGAYSISGMANKVAPPYAELNGKTWGIVGYGNIGRKVACIAEALGCRVIVNRRKPTADACCVDIDTLCRESDIISLHTPLNEETRGLISRERIAQMRRGVLLTNVARGAVVDEAAVADAVLTGQIGGFGCDVYTAEPFPATHPYDQLRRRDNVCLLPHMAWASIEARRRCLIEIIENINAFSAGMFRNRIV